ncbi:MAG: hypothetical protein AB8F78_05095 [Saprospiraceae bacterium]
MSEGTEDKGTTSSAISGTTTPVSDQVTIDIQKYEDTIFVNRESVQYYIANGGLLAHVQSKIQESMKVTINNAILNKATVGTVATGIANGVVAP